MTLCGRIGPGSAKLQRYVSATRHVYFESVKFDNLYCFKLNKTQEMSLKTTFLNQGLPYPPYIRGLARGSDANISMPLGWVKQFM